MSMCFLTRHCNMLLCKCTLFISVRNSVTEEYFEAHNWLIAKVVT